MEKEIKTSTTYFTSAGPVEVPGPSIPVPEMIATRKSNLAPLWLVFPGHIMNTFRIRYIELREDYIRVNFENGYSEDVHVTDIKETWSALQKAFSEGLAD